ncbi:MAG: hypothetical protein GX591_11795, partial [Planctomycetes bacterium]|nr:hypothetical protein [Planctomycetota bacterium]
MATWQEITGTRTIDCAEPPFIDVRIDFMAAVGADLPALGLTYIELRDGDLGRVEMWRGDDRN